MVNVFKFPISLIDMPRNVDPILNPGSTRLPVNNNNLIYSEEMQRELGYIFAKKYVPRGQEFLQPISALSTPLSLGRLRPVSTHKYCYPSGHCSLSEFVDKIVNENETTSDTPTERIRQSANEYINTPLSLIDTPLSNADKNLLHVGKSNSQVDTIFEYPDTAFFLMSPPVLGSPHPAPSHGDQFKARPSFRDIPVPNPSPWQHNFHGPVLAFNITSNPFPTRTPAPITTRTPAPITTSTPSPITTSTPSPIATRTPAHAHYAIMRDTHTAPTTKPIRHGTWGSSPYPAVSSRQPHSSLPTPESLPRQRDEPTPLETNDRLRHLLAEFNPPVHKPHGGYMY